MLKGNRSQVLELEAVYYYNNLNFIVKLIILIEIYAIL